MVEIKISVTSGTNLEFNHLLHHPCWGKNLLDFYLHRMIDLDTLCIKSYHMNCHKDSDETQMIPVGRFLDFVTGVD